MFAHLPRLTLRGACRSAQRVSVLWLAFAASLVGAQATAPVTAPLSSVAIYPQREVSAQIVPRNQSKVAAQVGGVITRWRADVGQRVAKGALLVELDTRDLGLALAHAQAQLNTAQAQLKLAQAQERRAQDLTAQGFFSKEALHQSQTQYQVAQAQANAAQAQKNLAQRQLDKARITAPFDAEITQRMAQAGETIAAGAPLFVLTEIHAPELAAELGPDQASSLRRVERAELVIGSHSQSLPMKGARLSQSANASTRTHSLRLSLGGDANWTPGASAVLRWQEVAPFAPAQLLVRRGPGLGLFLVENGKALFHPLPGAQEGQPARLDLPLSTTVVTQGQQRLQDGQSLTP